MALPGGLVESSRLPQPMFTPSTKAEIGDHDENITLRAHVRDRGRGRRRGSCTRSSVPVYSKARDHAAKRGIIIADTKFEFGLVDGEVTLVDEVLTPDSSRFWPAGSYEAGHGQPSLRQAVRARLAGSSGWDKTPPAPALPADVIAKTSEKYIQAYELITGRTFEPERG